MIFDDIVVFLYYNINYSITIDPMKISANDIKIKNILKINNRLKSVIKVPEHTKPGKGPAYIQLELRDLDSKAKTILRLNSNDTVEKAYFESKEYEYLYSEGDQIILMDRDSFEQVYINKDLLEDKVAFLSDNMLLSVVFYESKAIEIILPETVTLKIKITEPIIKGSRVNSSYKPATLENDMVISVPQYLKIGDNVVVKTDDSSFVERSNKS